MRRVVILAFVSACGPRVLVDGEHGEGTTSIGASETTSTSASPSSSSSTEPDATSSSGSSSGATDASTSTTVSGCPFVCAADVGDTIAECDIWAQDCPLGQKCMPWANDGGNSWNATRCSPITERPKQPGEACTVEGSGVSGIDDCDRGSLCWDVDPETNEGTCVAMCVGSAETPSCVDANSQCIITNEGVLILCLESCDPVVQNCVEGEACYPYEGSFACSPDAQNEGWIGEPCDWFSDCDPGLFCDDPSAFPDCPSQNGCCSKLCDLFGGAPYAYCPDGFECVAWFEPGQAPPGLDHVGYCVGVP